MQFLDQHGAGSGYLSKRMAALVFPGKVLAVDVQPQMVEMLRALSGRTATHNVVAVQATASDPNLPVNSVDLAILVDVYHELEFLARAAERRRSFNHNYSVRWPKASVTSIAASHSSSAL